MTRRTCKKCGAELAPPARFCMQCGSPVEQNRRALGQLLQEDLGPNYEVMGEIGRGGFAVVYLVGERGKGRYLAVKVMRQELMLSGSVIARFRREIKFASRLQHPNIVSVTFSVEKPDLVYYAMPRARGIPLSKHLEQCGSLPVDETLGILHQLADGLEHAHAHKVVHRDIKPSNVMLGPGGEVQILDFGVAKGLSRDGSSLSISGELLGSPEYMSPEQAAGSKQLDHRTDIYSWGVVGYEMLAGLPPFTARSVQAVLHKHMTESPPDVRTHRADTPEHVATVLNKCLMKHPEQRWESISEAAAHLGQ